MNDVSTKWALHSRCGVPKVGVVPENFSIRLTLTPQPFEKFWLWAWNLEHNTQYRVEDLQ